jgi:hypothetical protein
LYVNPFGWRSSRSANTALAWYRTTTAIVGGRQNSSRAGEACAKFE